MTACPYCNGAGCMECRGRGTVGSAFRANRGLPMTDREVLTALVHQGIYGYDSTCDGSGMCRSVADYLIAAGVHLGSPRADALGDEGLDDLRALSEAATPGPWITRITEDGREPRTYVTREFGVAVPPKFYIAFMPRMASDDDGPDAAFIAAAVNYVRARLTEGDSR